MKITKYLWLGLIFFTFGCKQKKIIKEFTMDSPIDAYVGIKIRDPKTKELIALTGDKIGDEGSYLYFWGITYSQKLGNEGTKPKTIFRIPEVAKTEDRNRENYTRLRDWVERTEEELSIDICGKIRKELKTNDVCFTFENAEIKTECPEMVNNEFRPVRYILLYRCKKK